MHDAAGPHTRILALSPRWVCAHLPSVFCHGEPTTHYLRWRNTSAPYGIARFLFRLIEDYEPEYLGVVFDAGDSFRTEVYPEYKATREKMPDELRASLPRCRDIFAAFCVTVIEAEGW